jgi:hypothetical protein
MKTKLMAGLLTAIVMMSCGTKKNEVKDGPTTGTISLGVDESFQRVVEAEKVAFRDN